MFPLWLQPAARKTILNFIMWTQYTREKPAHPGWTIATMAIALVGTLAIAQLQVLAWQPESWEPAMTVKSESWPVTFKLPGNLDWSRTPEIDRLVESSNEVVFLGKKGGGVLCRVSFFVGPENDPAIADRVNEIPLGRQTIKRFSVNIAGEDGDIYTYSSDSGARHHALCVAKQLDGKMISVFVETKEKPPFALKVADWIAASAEKASSNNG